MSAGVGADCNTRYAISPSDSTLTFEARSTLHNSHGNATGLSGFIVAAWNPDGSLADEPGPEMHVEFPVGQLRSGNGMQDREMFKLIDGARFPRVAADLRDVHRASEPGRYQATGDITFAGRSRKYNGEFAILHDDGRINLDGLLSIDIRDFGLKPPSFLMLKVEPVVNVRLRLVARKAT